MNSKDERLLLSTCHFLHAQQHKQYRYCHAYKQNLAPAQSALAPALQPT
jgi:hypothetical protein